jgi:hypothetical protein
LAKKKGLVCPLDEEMDDKWIEEFLFPEKSLEASGRKPLNFEYIHKSWPNRMLLSLFYTMNMKQKVGQITKSLTHIEVSSATMEIMRRNTKLPCVSAENQVK